MATLLNLSTVLEKLSNLLIQQSDFLLGAELYIQKIESMLLPRLSEEDTDQEKLNELIHNIEDAITELIITSENKWKRHTFLLYFMAFGVQPKDLFFVMLVMQLIDHSKLVLKWSDVYNHIFQTFVFYSVPLSGSFERNSDGLSVRNTIIFGTIMQFEALAAEKQLSPTVKREVLWLCDNFKSFQEFLKDVDIEKLSKEDMVWIDQVFDVCFSANNVVSSFLSSVQKRRKKNGQGSLKKMIMAVPNLISKHKLTAKLSHIKDHVCDIADRKPQLISTPVSLSNNVRSLTLASAADQLDRVSFDEDVHAITEKLLVEDASCITISILGVAGIGKTSLAKLVYTNEAIVQHFPLRLWVSGTSEMDIMEKILGVGGCLDDSQIIRIVNTVFADKRFLIVVDDSCASNFWGRMSGVFRNLFNGSRIIFTVRKQNEAPPISETNFNYRLHLRSDDETWALFMHTLKLNISTQLEKDVKTQILRKSGGLPKAIVNLAGLFSKREATLEEWSRVLEQLNQDEEPWPQIQKDINKYLPLYLRRCLFYFGLFPADYKIPARRLINLWVAEGLVCGRGYDSYERSAESVAEQCLEELENYNMVQVIERKLNGKIKACRLPEALRIHWLAKAKETNFLQGHSNITLGIRRLADHLNQDDATFQHIHGNNSPNLYPCYRNSVSFISFDSREDAGKDIGNFLERCISGNCFFFLLVLDLETVYRPILPKALSKLTRLRYLGLRSTYLERLPMFIDKLLSLQTLDLKRTCINTLPRSIWKMQKLRHLFLDQSFRTIFQPRLVESFLEELQTIWGLFIDENSPVKNGLDTLPNITKLGLKSKVSMQSQKDAMSSQLKAVENWVMNLKGLEKLRLKSFDESEQPWDLHLDSLSDHTDLSSVHLVGKLKNQQVVSKFPQNLIELTLSASGLVDDPMQTLDKLPKLKILRLYSKSFTGKRMVCSCGGFPKLQVLKLWGLENLEAWDMEEGSFPHLKDLEIRRCMNLKMLPDALQYVKTLLKVKLTKLPLLSQKIKDINGEDWIKISHVVDVCIEN
ncbi:probable disease resistance RPP8-like protein 2 [Euphorbia lathyris]|uniref:probable disease resistance RPP8-like protein 2 n=1 Tax=Euphorbia lathyris TaxID=212925 RepID=UPI0033137463